ncbi:MAG: hypothetical protein IJ840_01435 [Bacteroidales bacterium]|nr:hypothetical protein [Bacteroidales bacterium]
MPSSFESFVLENEEAGISRLLLSHVDWPSPPEDLQPFSFDGKELAISTIEARLKLRDKVPEWYSRSSLVFPSSLSAEQCGSTVTAFYKASLAGRILGGRPGRIADLTGGLGVDSWAFSSVASEVFYNERDPRIVAAVRHNFAELGLDNVRFSCREVAPGSVHELLGGTVPDIIYYDPARRSKDGNKVFLLEDCSPDVLSLLPESLSVSRHVLLKLSPMADISMVVERIDRNCERYFEAVSGTGWNRNRVREIHVVASGGECKELLIWIDREWDGEYSVTCREDGGTLSFRASEIASSTPRYPESAAVRLLFEPGKSLAKAGAWNVLCGRFGLVKLARSTNLFSIDREALAPVADPVILNAEPVILNAVKDLRLFGKVFEVEEVVKMDRTGMKDVGKRFTRSEVSARNIPMSSDELRSRLGVRSGDDAHIFGVRIETPFQAANFLLVCHRI